MSEIDSCKSNIRFFVEDVSYAVDTFLAILPAEGAKPMATATTARRTIRVAYILVLELVSCYYYCACVATTDSCCL